MLLHHIINRSEHFLGGSKSHWSLWHVAMLVVVDLVPGGREPGHGCCTCDDLPEWVRMSRVQNRIDLSHLHAELWLKCFSWVFVASISRVAWSRNDHWQISLSLHLTEATLALNAREHWSCHQRLSGHSGWCLAVSILHLYSGVDWPTHCNLSRLPLWHWAVLVVSLLNSDRSCHLWHCSHSGRHWTICVALSSGSSSCWGELLGVRPRHLGGLVAVLVSPCNAAVHRSIHLYRDIGAGTLGLVVGVLCLDPWVNRTCHQSLTSNLFGDRTIFVGVTDKLADGTRHHWLAVHLGRLRLVLASMLHRVNRPNDWDQLLGLFHDQLISVLGIHVVNGQAEIFKCLRMFSKLRVVVLPIHLQISIAKHRPSHLGELVRMGHDPLECVNSGHVIKRTLQVCADLCLLAHGDLVVTVPRHRLVELPSVDPSGILDVLHVGVVALHGCRGSSELGTMVGRHHRIHLFLACRGVYWLCLALHHVEFVAGFYSHRLDWPGQSFHIIALSLFLGEAMVMRRVQNWSRQGGHFFSSFRHLCAAVFSIFDHHRELEIVLGLWLHPWWWVPRELVSSLSGVKWAMYLSEVRHWRSHRSCRGQSGTSLLRGSPWARRLLDGLHVHLWLLPHRGHLHSCNLGGV